MMLDAKFMSHVVSEATYDAVVDGAVISGLKRKTVYVTDESELDLFENEAPGTFAVAYGMGSMWQLKPHGTWATIYAPAEEQSEEEG